MVCLVTPAMNRVSWPDLEKPNKWHPMHASTCFMLLTLVLIHITDMPETSYLLEFQGKFATNLF